MSGKNMTHVLIRMPISIKLWLKSQTAMNGSSVTAEVVQAVLERKERIQRNTKAARIFRS